MKKISEIFLTIVLFTLNGLHISAQSTDIYSFDKKIALPGDGSYDYIALDPIGNKLYVSHGTSVNVVDLGTEKPVGEISGMKGVHGIAIDPNTQKGFISDGKGNAVIAFDLSTFKKLATIQLSSPDPDAIIYDSFSKKVFSFNGDGKNISVLDPIALKEIGKIELGGGPEFAVSNGKGKIYNNIEDKNLIKTIDVQTMKVVAEFPLAPCGGPTGLAMDTGNSRLFTACRENKGMSVVDMNSGKVIMTLPIGAGVDAVVYDPVTKLIFCSCGDGTTTIIKQEAADSYKVVQTLKTQNRAKTMALDLKTHKIYLSAPGFTPGTRKVKPGSFSLFVYKRN